MESGGAGLKNWSPLHHQVWRSLRQAKLNSDRTRPFLVCVSGGADSMALLHIVKDLPIAVTVFHAHHGPELNSNFRDSSQRFVEDYCVKHKISIVTTQSKVGLKSENEMRKFRRAGVLKWLKQNPQGIVMTAHHAEDLLETRILRLIRGTGPHGLTAMSIWSPPFFRPFLELSSQDLRKFLADLDQTWVEDPSNQDSRYLRNWVRNRWLPALEKRKPGSVQRLSQSLESMIPELSRSRSTHEILRSEYASLTAKQQLEALAQLMRSHGLFQFTMGQLKEIQKRLDNPQKHLIFNIAGALWSVNAERITVALDESSRK